MRRRYCHTNNSGLRGIYAVGFCRSAPLSVLSLSVISVTHQPSTMVPKILNGKFQK